MESEWKVLLLLPFFSVPTLSTKRASCNGWTLTAPDEGDLSCNPTGTIISIPGTKCRLTCNTGYRAQHDELVCSETGGWDPENSPECLADSTMTLVIVLSIVASIIVIFGLSVLYAKTSKKCRGRRRKLEDDDPEAATKRVQNTTEYYGQVKKLQQKQRLHAKRQSRSLESKRKKKPDLDKITIKSSSQSKRRRGRKRSTNSATIRSKSKTPITTRTKKNRTKPSTKARQERKRHSAIDKSHSIKERQKKTKRKRYSQTTTTNEHESTDKTSTNFKKYRKNIVLRNFKSILFCVPFKQRRRKPTQRKSQKVSEGNVKTGNINHSLRKDVRKRSLTAADSPISSSSSTEDEEYQPKKRRQSSDKVLAKSKNPPPRPPPPKFATLSARRRERSLNNSETEGPNKLTVSSGYSSEGGKLQKQSKESQSKTDAKDDDTLIVMSELPNKRIQVMTYNVEEGDSTTTLNPYDNYPVAQSYRQYLDFENDYRRTTGDYHPQYGNVKEIPIQTTKKNKKKADENPKIADDQTPAVKSTQGGMKYIGICRKESDEKKSSSKKNHNERYENPSGRDRRMNTEDRQKKEVINRPKKRKKEKYKSKRLNDRKNEIADEKIIVNGTTLERSVPKSQQNKPQKIAHKLKKSEKSAPD